MLLRSNSNQTYGSGQTTKKNTSLRIAHEFLCAQSDALFALRNRFRTCMRRPFVDQIEILDFPRMRRDVAVAAMSCLLIATEIENVCDRCSISNTDVCGFEREQVRALISDLRSHNRFRTFSNSYQKDDGFCAYTDAEFDAFEKTVKRAVSAKWSLGERAPIVTVLKKLRKL